MRGPVTWRSKEYEVSPDAEHIEFTDDKFSKKSGLYFTKKGAE